MNQRMQRKKSFWDNKISLHTILFFLSIGKELKHFRSGCFLFHCYRIFVPSLSNDEQTTPMRIDQIFMFLPFQGGNI